MKFFKVFYIQVFSYKKLNNLSDDLWSRNLPISASRGRILDRNGTVLADNTTITSLVIIPNQVKNPKEVAKTISEILNTNYEDMYKHVTKKTSIERVHPEGRNLSFSVLSTTIFSSLFTILARINFSAYIPLYYTILYVFYKSLVFC